MNKEDFVIEIEKLNIKLSEYQINLLEKYYELLITWNKKINLTRITEKNEVYLKHFYDSLTLIKAIDLNKNLYVCDIGTGAGFPGIVLKIVFPNLKIVLVDSLGKRIEFLNEVIKKLNLSNIITINERAEIYIKNNIEKFDLITCRAVSKLNIISEICIPGLKINGYFIPMKAQIDEEIKNIGFINKLSSKIENIISFKLPKENSTRNLIIIKKIGKTNILYPRSFEKIKKRPLQ